MAIIKPSGGLSPLHLGVRGEIKVRRAIAKVANLAKHIAFREVDTIANALGWPRECVGIEEVKDVVSAGNVVTIEIGDEQVTELFTAFGRMETSAENVAREAVEEAKGYLASDASVGEHLADQLLIPMALAGSGSFVAQKLTPHAITIQ